MEGSWLYFEIWCFVHQSLFCRDIHFIFIAFFKKPDNVYTGNATGYGQVKYLDSASGTPVGIRTMKDRGSSAVFVHHGFLVLCIDPACFLVIHSSFQEAPCAAGQNHSAIPPSLVVFGPKKSQHLEDK